MTAARVSMRPPGSGVLTVVVPAAARPSARPIGPLCARLVSRPPPLHPPEGPAGMDNEFRAPSPANAVVMDSCQLRVPSVPDWIEPTVDFLVCRARAVGAVPPPKANRLMMALHEALTNSVIHGNLG